MSELTLFDFEGARLRVILDSKREPWFVAVDVATALGYRRPHDAVAAHVHKDDVRNCRVIDTIGRNQKTACTNESGMYSLILRSRLKIADQFKHWVTSEVLPSVRRTGQFVSPRWRHNVLTNPQYVYFLQRRDGRIKIGITENLRRRQRGLETAVGEKLELLAFFNGTRDDEAALHREFDTAREMGEWFCPTPELLSCVATMRERVVCQN